MFGAYTKYTKQYCNARRGRFGWDVKGISNAKELHEKLSKIMIRRLKSEVLNELPTKQRSIVPMATRTSSKLKECQTILEELDERRAAIKKLTGDDAWEANVEARTLLMSAYQASGIAKASAVADYVVDWLSGSNGEKVLVFAHHKEVLDTIEDAVAKKFKGIGHTRIDGSVSSANRMISVQKFQNDKSVRMALLSVTAAGVGLTLTAASTIIFAELHWTPGVLVQAEDRCHRIGQKNSVNVYYCIEQDKTKSIDMTLWNMLSRKMNNVGVIMDGKRNELDAAYDESATPSNQIKDEVGLRESGEDQLISFFAENKTGDIREAPAKGSIISFFKKKSITKESKKASKVSCSSCTFLNDSSSSACRMCGKEMGCLTYKEALSSPLASNGISSVIMEKKKIEVVEVTPDSSNYKWKCHFCTFLNKFKRSLGDRQTCSMCGHEQPSKSEARNNGIPLNSRAINQRKRLKLSLPEECKNQGAINVNHKNHIFDLTNECIVNESNLKDSSTSASQSNLISEIVQDIQTQPILNFSVSKHSGRVAAHLALTGELLNCNFEVDEVLIPYNVSKDSSKTKRFGSNKSKRLHFDDKALHNCKSKKLFLLNGMKEYI